METLFDDSIIKMAYGHLEVYSMAKKNKIVDLLSQRRVWAAILSAVAVIGLSLGYDVVPGVCTALAGTLGLHSYIKPKR